MPIVKLESVPVQSGSRYPAPYDQPVLQRRFQRLGQAAGLKQLGVTRLVLEPGVWSSQRHCHSVVDELMWLLEGEVVLIDDQGEHTMRAGDCAAFPAGDNNGHHVINRSDKPAVILAMSSMSEQDGADYPDIDMKYVARAGGGHGPYTRKDGTPY